MNAIKNILFICVIALTVVSCKDDNVADIMPSTISNLTAESLPGAIKLKWTREEPISYEYLKVEYFDHLLQKDVMKLASSYSDTILIEDTRAKFGDYNFKITPVSKTQTTGSTLNITARSGKAPASFVSNMIELTASDLSTNAQEPSEGPIAALLDGNTSTFFHTAWSVGIPGPHWMQVNLKKELSQYYSFYYAPRGNANNKPTDFDLLGSTDGNEWFLIKNFTQEEDGLPTSSSATYTSPILKVERPFSQIKISVNKTNNGSVSWTMSEFKFYDVSINDPEAE